MAFAGASRTQCPLAGAMQAVTRAGTHHRRSAQGRMCASERKIGHGKAQCALADKFLHFRRYWAGGTIRQIDLVQQAQQFLVRDILRPQRIGQLAAQATLALCE